MGRTQKTKGLLLLLILCFLGSPPVFSEIDDLKFYLENQYPGEPRWDNVASEPLWAGGPRLSYDRALSYHTAGLSRKNPLFLHVDEGAIIRIQLLQKGVDPNHLKASFSNGSGIFAPAIIQVSRDDKTLFVHAQQMGPSLFKLEMGDNILKKNVRIGVFVSRWKTLLDIARYDTTIPLNTPSLTSYRISQGMPRKTIREVFHSLFPQEKVKFKVTGPTRIALTTRVPYEMRHKGHAFSYTISILLNDTPFYQANLTVRQDDNALFTIKGKLRLLGGPETIYLEIPEGTHTLTLTPSTAVFATLHRLKTYFLGCPNKSPLERREPLIMSFPRPLQEINKKIFQNFLDGFEKYDPSYIQRAALALGTENSSSSSGDLGLYLMGFLKRRRPDLEALKTARNKTRIEHTFYRDLLPFSKDRNGIQKFFWIHEDVLRPNKEMDFEHYALSSQQDGLLENLKGGYFVALGEAHIKTTYALPKRNAPSHFRILVNKNALKEPVRLWVRFDDDPARPIDVMPKQDRKPSDLYLPSKGSIGLKTLALNFGGGSDQTTSGPFSLKKVPALHVEGGSVDLPLPQDVKFVHLWREGPSLEVAAQYLAARPFKMSSESLEDTLAQIRPQYDPKRLYVQGLQAYNACVIKVQDKTSCGVDHILTFLKDQGMTTRGIEEALRHLINHWMESYRVLITRHQVLFDYTKNPQDLYIAPPLHPTLSPKDVIVYQNKALMFAKKKDWVSVVETLSKLIKGGDAQTWKKAHLDRSTALEKSGEIILAQNTLKTLVCFSQDADLQQKAFDQLAGLYKNEKNDFALLGLITHQLLKSYDETLLSQLADAFLDDGKNKMSEDLVFLNPASDDWSEKAFSSFLKENVQNLGRISFLSRDPQKAARFKGHLAQWSGDSQEALDYYECGGAQGKFWKKYLQQALDIRDHLRSSDPQKRHSGALGWLRWQKGHPGAFTWENAHHLVSNYKKGLSVYNKLRDSHDLGYVASQESPLSLKIAGPQKMRFLVRPLMMPRQKELLPKDWITLRDGQEERNFALDRTYFAPEYTAFGLNLPLGTATVLEYDVGPGIHEISLFAEERDVVIQPLMRMPVTPLAPLPQLTPATLEAALGGDWVHIQEAEINPSNAYILKDGAFDAPNDGTLFNVQFSRPRALREEDLSPSFPGEAIPAGDNPTDAFLERFGNAVRAYEQNKTQSHLTRVSRFWVEAADKAPLLSLWSRVTRLAVWERVLPDSSAGMRTLRAQKSLTPDAPGLRIRRALMKEAESDDYILSSFSRLEFTLVNPAPLELKIQSDYETLITRNKVALALNINVDGQKHRLKSSEGKKNSFLLSIPQGEHYLGISLDAPIADVVARLKISERAQGAKKWEPFLIEEEKNYQVATKDQPVVVRTQGPAWVRIDHLEEGDVLSQNRFIPEGLQTLTIMPAGNQEKTLYQVFRFVPGRFPKEIKVLPPPLADWTVGDVPFSPSNTSMPEAVHVQDGLLLPGQSDGTWSVGASWNRAGASDSITPTPLSDTYMEQRVSYHFFDELKRRSWTAHALAREHGSGSPSFGGIGKLLYYPASLPLTLSAQADIYTQRFNMAASLHLSAAHEMELTRTLSQRTTFSTYGTLIRFAKNTRGEVIDPDVFTNYKDTHRRGLEIEYELIYEPFYDTRFWALAGETANPDFNLAKPDHLTFKAGYDQLIGPVTLSLEYGFKPYFSDRDRETSFNRTAIGAALRWDYWYNSNNRFEFGARMTRNTDIPSGSNRTTGHFWTGILSVIWHFNQGRGYRDFRQEEALFHSMRERLVPPSGNQISYPGTP